MSGRIAHNVNRMLCAVLFIFFRQIFRDTQLYFDYRKDSRQIVLQYRVSPLKETHLLPFHPYRSL